MTVKEYLESLGTVSTDIDITVVTEARMRKKRNPFKDVFKVQNFICQVNYDYEKIMSAKHGAWVSDHRTWGVRKDGQCLIKHKEELYVSIYILKSSTPLYFNAEGVISLVDIFAFLFPPSTSPVRDINIKNIILWPESVTQ